MKALILNDSDRPVSAGKSGSRPPARDCLGTSDAGAYWLCPGCVQDLACALIGTSVSVYWTDDATFYNGVINAFDEVTGAHRVLYLDREWEFLSLSNEIVWFRYKPPDETAGRGSSNDTGTVSGSGDAVAKRKGDGGSKGGSSKKARR